MAICAVSLRKSRLLEEGAEVEDARYRESECARINTIHFGRTVISFRFSRLKGERRGRKNHEG